MLQQLQHVPPNIYALADHLDTALAACEDLLKLDGPRAEPGPFLGSLLKLELTAIMHVLQARQHLRELRFDDGDLANQAALFLDRTACLEEPLKRSAGALDITDPIDHLRSYGITAGTIGTGAGGLAVKGQVLIGRQIPIATVRELAAATLDALEVRYPIFDVGGDQASLSQATVAAHAVNASPAADGRAT